MLACVWFGIQFEGQEYWAICEEEGADLGEMGLGIPPDALAIYFDTYGCTPLRGDAVLAMMNMEDNTKWACLGYAALAFPVLLAVFYCTIRFVNHEHR